MAIPTLQECKNNELTRHVLSSLWNLAITVDIVAVVILVGLRLLCWRRQQTVHGQCHGGLPELNRDNKNKTPSVAVFTVKPAITANEQCRNVIRLVMVCHKCQLAGLLPTIAMTMTIQLTFGAFPPSLRQSGQLLHHNLPAHPIVPNLVTTITTSCDLHTLNMTVTLERSFKGIVFAKDFSQECRSLGTMSNSLSVTLPTSGCGIRMSVAKPDIVDGGGGSSRYYYYAVTLVVQQDKYLRQITDQEKVVQCRLADSAFALHSRRMADAVRDEIKSNATHRTGRMKEEGWSKDSDDDKPGDRAEKEKKALNELTEALAAARAWMEIVPVQQGSHSGTIQVGEDTLLLVKSTLPAGIGWKVIECTAHDGLGESSQKLLDEVGCPVDELLLPELLKGPSKPIALMRHQEAVSRFAAFKFPDRDRLHVKCGMQLCRGNCQKVDCHTGILNDSTNFDNRLGRNLQKGESGEILDRLEVFNSVEVLAPAIELDNLRQSERLQSSEDYLTATFGAIPGDRTVCVSPDKMAISLCVLGVIFLGAVAVAACALYRARAVSPGLHSHHHSSSGSCHGSASGWGCSGPSSASGLTAAAMLPYQYTRSLFSSSSGGDVGNGGGPMIGLVASSAGGGSNSGGSGYSGGGCGSSSKMHLLSDSSPTLTTSSMTGSASCRLGVIGNTAAAHHHHHNQHHPNLSGASMRGYGRIL